MKYIVELEYETWIAPWDGDPGRTLVKDTAKRFRVLARAKLALKQARRYSPFADAKIIGV